MGKITKIVYTCDICGAESNTNNPTCKFCNKDYCLDHAALLIGAIELERPSASIKLVEVNQGMCSDCASNVVKWKELLRKELGPEPPKFIIKA